MKTTLYLYHEQWINFPHPDVKIVPWHIQVPDEIDTSRVRIFIKAVEVDIPDVPPLEEAEVKQALVTGLYQQKKDIQAETQVKLDEIDNTIQQLLAITYNPPTEEELL